jgi:hypothetical protein
VKDKNHLIRLIIILGIGIFLTYKIYNFRFSTFIFDLIIFGGIAIIGIIFWLWSINKDLKQFKLTKKKWFLSGTLLGIIFFIIIIGINWKNNSYFNKPTLIRGYYDGDFNGSGIDFKKDGTYVFENHAMGFSDFIFGLYKIEGNIITLDRNDIDNVIKTNKLEIKSYLIKYPEEDKDENFLIQIRENGEELKGESGLKIIIDNRN